MPRESQDAGSGRRRHFGDDKLRRARLRISSRGQSIRQWSEERGFSYTLVRKVVAGGTACHFGASHDIAVALGLKQAMIPAPADDRRPAQPETACG